MTDKQPEALRLADVLDDEGDSWWDEQAAAELRRLHEENQQWQEKCNTYIQIHDAVVKDNERLHEMNAELPVGTMLYTAPPQREWQGLTENEKELLWDEAVDGKEHFCSQYGDFADAIEAKLKQKNA